MATDWKAELAKGFVSGVGSYIGEQAAGAVFSALGLESNPNEGVENAIAQLQEVLSAKLDVMISELNEIQNAIKDLDEHAQDNAHYVAWSEEDDKLESNIISHISSLWDDAIYNRRSYAAWKQLASADGGVLQLGDFLLSSISRRQNGIIDLFVDFLVSDSFSKRSGWKTMSKNFLLYVEHKIHYVFLAFVMAKAVESDESHQRGIIQSFLDKLEEIENICFTAHIRVLAKTVTYAGDNYLAQGPFIFDFHIPALPYYMSMEWWDSPDLADPWNKFEMLWQEYRAIAQTTDTAVTRTTMILAWNFGPLAQMKPDNILSWQKWLSPTIGGGVAKAEIHSVPMHTKWDWNWTLVRCVFFLAPGTYTIAGDESIFPPIQDCDHQDTGGPERWFADGYYDFSMTSNRLASQAGHRPMTVTKDMHEVTFWLPYMGVNYFTYV